MRAWKRHYANRMIGASKVANVLDPTGSIPQADGTMGWVHSGRASKVVLTLAPTGAIPQADGTIDGFIPPYRSEVPHIHQVEHRASPPER